MLTAAALTCFYGFFRAGEITVPSIEAYDPVAHLSIGDVSMDSNTQPTTMMLHLRKSKCDQFGKGVEVYIGRVDSLWYPVKAMVEYLTMRGPQAGHLFVFHDGSPLTKAKFREYI